MVKNPKKFRALSERANRAFLRDLSLREGIKIGEALIRASFRAQKPRPHTDLPKALSFYARQSH